MEEVRCEAENPYCRDRECIHCNVVDYKAALKALREAAARLCAVLTPGALDDEEATALAALIALLPDGTAPLRALQAVLGRTGEKDE